MAFDDRRAPHTANSTDHASGLVTPDLKVSFRRLTSGATSAVSFGASSALELEALEDSTFDMELVRWRREEEDCTSSEKRRVDE